MAVFRSRLAASGWVKSAGICCTMKTGAPKSPGSAGIKRANAAGPPVDTPISTSGDPVRDTLRPGRSGTATGGEASTNGDAGCEAPANAGRVDGRRSIVRISRCRSKARIIGCSLSRRSARFWAEPPPSGLVRKSKAPSSNARTVISPPRTVRELRTITPALWPAGPMASSTSMPLISGISMSSVTRSGCSAAMRDSASLPLAAVPTTSTPGTPARASETARRNTTVSSTTRTRVAIGLLVNRAGSLRAFRQNRARIEYRDHSAASPADSFEESGLPPGNVGGRRLPIVALYLHNLVHTVYQQSDKLVAVFDDKYPAVACRDGLREPEPQAQVQDRHDLAPEVDDAGYLLGGVTHGSQRSDPDHFLDSSGVEGAQ